MTLARTGTDTFSILQSHPKHFGKTWRIPPFTAPSPAFPLAAPDPIVLVVGSAGTGFAVDIIVVFRLFS